jgi:hypothetical protein
LGSQGNHARTPRQGMKPDKQPGAVSPVEMPTIEWTRKARLAVLPRRGFPCEGYASPRDSERLLGSMRSRYRSYRHELRPDRAEGEARGLMEAAQSLMDGTPDPADVDVEAAAAVLLGINEEHPYVQEERGPSWIVDYWVSLRGCTFALQVMVRTFSLGISHNDDYFDTGSEFGPTPPSYSWLSSEHGHSPVLEKGDASLPFNLRLHLAAASEKDYVSAREWATRQRLSFPLIIQCALACAFPDEDLWSIEAVRECLLKVEQGRFFPDFGKPLLTSLKDPALMADLMSAARINERELFYAPTLLDTMGPTAAFPILCALLGEVPASYMESTTNARRICAEALASIRSEAVASFFIPYRDDKDICSIASDYLKGHPTQDG